MGLNHTSHLLCAFLQLIKQKDWAKEIRFKRLDGNHFGKSGCIEKKYGLVQNCLVLVTNGSIESLANLSLSFQI